MPESDAPSSNRARAKPQQESRQRVSSTDQGQTTAGPAAGMPELQRPGESFLGSDFSQATFERHAALLGESRLSRPANARVRMQVAQQLQRDYGNRYVQRLVKHISRQRAEASNSSLESPLVQAAEQENQTGDAYPVGPDIAERIESHRSSGESLESGTRQEMESTFGSDFSDVRVHTGSEAHELNEEVQAEAFTSGKDIFFREGNYQPYSPEGKQLLAHELTHVSGVPTNDVPNGLQRQAEDNPLQSNHENGSSFVHRCGDQPCNCSAGKKAEAVAENEHELVQRSEESKTAEIRANEGNGLSSENISVRETPKTSTALEENNPEEETASSNGEVLQSAVLPNGDAAEGTGAPDESGSTNPHLEISTFPDEPLNGIHRLSVNRVATPTPTKEDEMGAAGPAAGEGTQKAPEGSSLTQASGEVGKVEAKVEAPSPEDVASADSNPAAEAMEAAAPEGDMESLKATAESQLQAESAETGEGGEEAISQVSEAQALEQVTTNEEPPEEIAGLETAVVEAQARSDVAATKVSTAAATLQATGATAASLGSTQMSFAEISLDGIEGAEQQPELLSTLDQQRTESNNLVQSYMSNASDRIQTITSLGEEIPIWLQAAAEAAKVGIEASIQEQSASVSAHIAQVLAQSEGAAQGLREKVNSRHDASIANIIQKTDVARSQVETQYQSSLQLLTDREATQRQTIDTNYADADAAYRKVGVDVGETITQRGETRAKEYETDEGGIKAPKDGLMDGYLTRRRAKARVQAARAVAKSYKEHMIKEANKQADAAQKGKPKDHEFVTTTVTKARETLENQYNATLTSLTARQEGSSSEANKSKSKLMESIQISLNASQADLRQQEVTEHHAIESAGLQQSSSIDQAAQESIADLQLNVNQAATGLQTQLLSLESSIASMQVPDVASLGAALSGATAQIDAGVSSIQGQVEQTLSTTEQNLAAAAQNTVERLATVGQMAIDVATTTGDQFNTTLSVLEQGANNTYSSLEQAHDQELSRMVQSSTQGFQKVMSGIDQTFQKMNSNLQATFAKAVPALEKGLRDAIGPMDAKITEEAKAAAAKEKPAWQGIVKWIAIIAVIVVVALVAGPFVIGAVGAFAGSLGASAALAGAIGTIVGGGIVGAATSATIQVINNVADGEPVFKGIGMALATGFIGGALGGAAGFYIGRLKDVSFVAKFALETAADVVVDTGINVATGQFSVENLGMGLLMSVGMNAFTSGLSANTKVGDFQQSMMGAGEAFGGGLGARIRGGSPDVDVGAPSGGRTDVDEGAPAAGGRTDVDEGAPAAGGRTDVDEGAPAAGGRTDVDEGAPAAGGRTDPEAETTGTRQTENAEADQFNVKDHEVTVLEDGRIYVCSRNCRELGARYKDELDANPKLQEELEIIDKIKNREEKRNRINELLEKLVEVRSKAPEAPISGQQREFLRKASPSKNAKSDPLAKFETEDNGMCQVYHEKPTDVEVDHIVTFDEIVTMDGFSRLSSEAQLEVLNYSANLKAISQKVNGSRQATPWSEYKGHSKYPDIDENGLKFIKEMANMEQKLRPELQDLIKTKLSQQEPQ